MLELHNICKTFNQKTILKNISFNIKNDETICLLGASGSGKSTILKMIAGLDSPDEGTILFNSLDLTPTPPHLRDFGLVFQDFNLFPHLTVFDNIAFGLRVGKRSRNMESSSLLLDKQKSTLGLQNIVTKLLNQVNLQGYENRKVTNLSGGEQQRIALARALATQPRLLMLDEPLGALDKSLKENLLNQIRNILHKTKIPAIYVTHDVDEAFAIADRILILHEGTIIRDDTPQEIWKNPKYVAVAKLLGIGNVIEGEAIAKNKVKTEFGIFNLNCKQNKNEKINVLLTQSTKGEVINVRVDDVTFKQNQFEVKSRDAKFLISKKPKIGDVIKINVQVECLL